jgi:hypothetical protein
MSDRGRQHHGKPAPARRPAPTFRARGTIGLFWLAGFFFAFSLLQVLPDLVSLLGQVPATPEQERALEQAAQEVAHGGVNVYVSLALALGTTALGTWLQVLPGMRAG